MKKILFATILMITSIAAFSQEQPKPVLQNQFADYVQFQKEHQKSEFGPHHFPFHPKPEKVIVKGEKVILIFNKSDFQKLRPEIVETKVFEYRERPHGRFRQMMDEHFNQ